jgi:hypothetical protein
MSIKSEVMEMRNLFWSFYYGRIALVEMQAGIREVMDRQLTIEKYLQ